MSAAPKHSGDEVDAALAKARSLIESAAFDEAEAVLHALLDEDLNPRARADALYTMAVAHRYAKRHDAALTVLDEVVSAWPEHGRAYQEQGYVYLAQNRAVDAANAFRQAVGFNPGLAASWTALAGLEACAGHDAPAAFARARADRLKALPRELASATDLMHERRLGKAERLCRHFLRANPRHIEGMRLLAEIGIRLGVYHDAEFLLESCVALAPEQLEARADYVSVLNRKGKFARALEQAEILCRARPKDNAFELGKATALAGVGRLEEAVALYEQCLPASANRPGVHVSIGHAQKALGNFDAAIGAYRAAYSLRPDYGDAYWSLANTKTYRFTDGEIEQILHHEGAPRTSFEDRVHLCFAAGKAFEDRSDWAASFDHYARGNALKKSRSGYDPDKTETLVQAQIDVLTPALFEARRSVGYDCPDPIFIVGLPRAGSTLLEQILASHSSVDGTMELHNVLGLAQRLSRPTEDGTRRYPDLLRDLDDDYFERFGRQFIEQTRAYRHGAPLFIDKMPNNFLHIGLIKLMLPRAKIIDARRRPMACCFSAFKQLFGEGQEFSYDLEWLGRYYRDYVRLMAHWDRVLPGFVLRVMHEDVVSDLESQVRRLLDFCGLPFEAACLEFHASERSVRTPSSEQVRQPIYKTGLEHWRHYEPYLDPLRAALGTECA